MSEQPGTDYAGERLTAGDDWQDTGLVFTTCHGAALDAGNVRKMFKRVCAAVGIGDDWTRTPAHYTVEQCLKDWLETLNTQAETTITGYRIMTRHLTALIGNVKMVDLKVRDVGSARGKLAKRLSTRSIRLARMILIQAIRNAMVNDLLVRNVADLAVPTGKPGRELRPVTRNRGHVAGPAVREQREG
jgi:hypothetical protein